MRFATAAAIAALTTLAAACSSSSAPKVVHGIDHSADTGPLGYCRAKTCQKWLPTGYPTASLCEPPDFADSDTCKSQDVSDAPLWWATSCVGFDANAAGGRDIPYDLLAATVETAFATWSATTCDGGGHPSIAARDLGAVSCARATYDPSGGPNQNVIVFHDDAWPYEDTDPKGTNGKSLVIALTSVTFEKQTGEIFDADVELNSADYRILPVTAGTVASLDTFDLQTVLTHELGHFLGLAHAPGPTPVMNAAADVGGSSVKRELAPEDTLAICSVYTPDGRRSVTKLLDDSGYVPAGACDPTPHHGFRSDCP